MSKTSRRFTGLQVVARLRSIDEDDSGGESEAEQGDVLDWELCSSDEMSDDEETEQFDDTQRIGLGDLQTADTNVETHFATCFDDATGSGAAESSSTHETARDGTKWEFMEFGVEARGRHTAQNVLTEQSGLSRFALRMADSPVGAFQVLFDNHVLKVKHIQQCTNVEARRVLGNEEWEVSLCGLKAFISLLYERMYEERMVAKTFPFTIFGIKNGAYHFFNKLCRGIVVVRLCVFYALTCAAQGQHACKLTNLLLSGIFGIGL